MTHFVFRAGATALGGYFTRPFREPLEVHAATFLSPVGGYSSARVENFRFHELVSFKAAYSQVIGTEDAGDEESGRSTLSTAVVEGLNFLDIVTADRVVARLASESPLNAVEREPAWLPVGSYFVNLRIAGQAVSPSFDPVMLKEATLSAIREKANNPRHGADDHGRSQLKFRNETLACSIFKPLRRNNRWDTADEGYAIRIPGVGDLYLGEYVVAADHRQLTMVRLEMHSPVEGRLVACALEGNGSTY